MWLISKSAKSPVLWAFFAGVLIFSFMYTLPSLAEKAIDSKVVDRLYFQFKKSDKKIVDKQYGLLAGANDKKEAKLNIALNLAKSVYSLDEVVSGSFSVVDEEGFIVCDANIFGYVVDPRGVKTEISNDFIYRAHTCGDLPLERKGLASINRDHLFFIDTSSLGLHKINLVVKKGERSAFAEREFLVSDEQPILIERGGVDRVWEGNHITVPIVITATEDFSGIVKEVVPKELNIERISENGKVSRSLFGGRQIVWSLDLKKGEKKSLAYAVSFSEIKDDSWKNLYGLGPMRKKGAVVELGPVKLVGVLNKKAFNFSDLRAWQLALDADGDGTNTASPTTATAASTANKFKFTFTGANMSSGGEVLLRVPTSRGWSSPQASSSASAGYTIASASSTAVIGTVLHNADGGWVEHDVDTCNTALDGDLGLTLDDLNNRVSILCNNNGNAGPDAGDSFGFNFGTAQNLSGYSTTSFYLHSTVTTGSTNIDFALDNTEGCSSPEGEIDVPGVNANEWTLVELNISGITRTAVKTWCLNDGTGTGFDSKAIGIDDVRLTGASGTLILPTETVFVEDDTDTCNVTVGGNVNIQFVSSPVFEGTGAAHCNNTANTGPDAGDSFGVDFPTQDWSSYTTIGFWFYSDVVTVSSDIDMAIDNNWSCASPLGEADVPALLANTWTYVTFDISGITRTSVRTFCINAGVSTPGLDSKSVYIDDILIGPGLPTFTTNATNTDILVRLIRLGSGETLTITYGEGGGVAGVSAPTSTGSDTFYTQSRTPSASGYGTLTNISSHPVISVLASTTWEQVAYRWFANQDSALVGPPLAAENASATLSSTGDAFRLRMVLHVGASTTMQGGDPLKLQFATSTAGGCDPSYSGESYSDISTSTGAIRFNNNASVGDGALLTTTSTDPTHGLHTVVTQTYEEGNPFVATSTIAAEEDGIWDFSLVDAAATAETTYCFRVVKSDNALISTSTLSKIPEIKTAAAAPSGISVSGSVFSSDRQTAATSSVKLVVGGDTAYTTSTDQSGSYTITGITTPASGTVVTAWLESGGELTGAVSTRYSGSGNITGLDIYAKHLVVRHEDSGPITNTNLNTCDKTTGSECASANLHFDVSGGALTIDKDWGLYIWPEKTFTPGGALTLANGASSTDPGGDIIWGSSGSSLSISGSNLSVGGDFRNDVGGLFTNPGGSNSTTFTATSTGFVINSGGRSFSSVQFNGAGGRWSATSTTMTINGSLTMTAGTLSSASGTADIAVQGGSVTGDGAIDLTSGSFVQKLSSGGGSFGGNTDWNFNNLTFGNLSPSGVLTITSNLSSAATVSIAGVFSIGSSTDTHGIEFNSGSGNYVLSGASGAPMVLATSNSSVFDGANSKFSFTANNTSGSTHLPAVSFSDLTLENGSETFQLSGLATTTGNLNINSGTLDIGTSTLHVQGDLSLAGGASLAGQADLYLERSASLLGSVSFSSGTLFHLATSSQSLSIGTSTLSFYQGRFINRSTATTTLSFSTLGGVLQFSSTTGILGNQSGVAVVSSTAALDINGNLDIESLGRLKISTTTVSTLAGNFTNNGSFSAGSSTIRLDGSSQQTISGKLTGEHGFHVLDITNNSGTHPTSSPSVIFSNSVDATTSTITTASVKVRFAASATSTFTNIHWDGQSTSTPVYLRSSVASTSWGLVVTGSQTVKNIDVQDSNACAGDTINPEQETTTDSSGNSCWNLQSITLSISPTTLALPALTPGFTITGTSSLSVDISGGTSGYAIHLVRDSATSTLASSTTITFPDLTSWNSGTGCSPGQGNGTISPGETFSFRVRFSGTTSSYCSDWWGANDTDGVAKYSGTPTSSEVIMNCTSCNSGSTITIVGYRVDAPVIQEVTSYSGTVTFTALANP